MDYYSLANLCDSELSNECLLVAIYVHHIYLTQPNNFSRMMKRNDCWLSEVTMNKLIEIWDKINMRFGNNNIGRGHWLVVTVNCSELHSPLAVKSNTKIIVSFPKSW